MVPERLTVPNEEFFSWVEEELDLSGTVRMRVRGCSMYPFLRDGKDEVTLVLYRGTGLQRGQIVLFRYRGVHILHRVVKNVDGIIVIRGDNVFGHCEICSSADVSGVVIAVHRRCRGRSGPVYVDLSPESALWYMLMKVRRFAIAARFLIMRLLRGQSAI